MERIEELAKELLKKILDKYHNRPNWYKRSLGQMVEDELKNYNEEVRFLIEEKLYEILGDFYFENTNREIAVTPVLLSEMLYKNAKEVSKNVTKILTDAIKSKKTINALTKELYEGYGFREKEPLDLIDKYALPKYIKDELKRPKNIKKIMKQIEKLKTKPLRIAYKNIFRELDKMSYKGLERAMYTAAQEKARYYATRIAKTEIHRASMSKWAKEMLDDEEVKFVKYRLSTAHKIGDICDFYAHLDLGYGEGIYPKKEMRTLPLHPYCSCVYDPYYRKVKGKRKSWKDAVSETMSKFSEYEQRQILGSKEMLERFKNGEDIEKIFNTIRPKYPIKKYVDIFKNVNIELNGEKLYNVNMEKYEKAILKKFENFDVSSKENAIESFKKLWRNEEKLKLHVERRIQKGHVKDEIDYINKTLECLANSSKVTIAIYNNKSWDNLYYEAEFRNWAVIFNENGEIMTSYKVDGSGVNFYDAHKNADKIIKGVKNGLQDYFKKLYDRFRNNTNK